MPGLERRLSLLVVVLGLAASIALVMPDLPVLVRALAACALAFALPGTALGLALIPRAPLRPSERLAIALGGSMAGTIGTAFALHALPSGLTVASWAAFLGSVTVVGGLVAWVRTRPQRDARTGTRIGGGVPAADPSGDALLPGVPSADAVAMGPWVPGPPAGAARTWMVAPSALGMLAAAGVLTVLAFVLARGGVGLGPRAAFTELWLLPIDGGGSVRVGVANHEGDDATYRLVVTVDGQRLGAVRELDLADGEGSVSVVELPPGTDAARDVEVRLWQADQPDGDPPHRSVHARVTQDATAS